MFVQDLATSPPLQPITCRRASRCPCPPTRHSSHRAHVTGPRHPSASTDSVLAHAVRMPARSMLSGGNCGKARLPHAGPLAPSAVYFGSGSPHPPAAGAPAGPVRECTGLQSLACPIPTTSGGETTFPSGLPQHHTGLSTPHSSASSVCCGLHCDMPIQPPALGA